MPAPVASGWSDLAGWGLHPLESAAFSRRTWNADFLRRPVGLASQAHHPAHRLDEGVIAWPRRVGAGLAETGDRAIDEAGETVLELRVAQPVFRQCANLEVLDQDVALGDEAKRDRLAFRRRDIEGDRSLVAVDP